MENFVFFYSANASDIVPNFKLTNLDGSIFFIRSITYSWLCYTFLSPSKIRSIYLIMPYLELLKNNVLLFVKCSVNPEENIFLLSSCFGFSDFHRHLIKCLFHRRIFINASFVTPVYNKILQVNISQINARNEGFLQADTLLKCQLFQCRMKFLENLLKFRLFCGRRFELLSLWPSRPIKIWWKFNVMLLAVNFWIIH